MLALPAAYQAPAVAWMRVVLDVSALITLLIMDYVQWVRWRTALGHRVSAGRYRQVSKKPGPAPCSTRPPIRPESRATPFI